MHQLDLLSYLIVTIWAIVDLKNINYSILIVSI